MGRWQRTHTCGELRIDNQGQTITLNGWVNNWRDHGGLVFIDLRDRYGLTQIVFDPESNPAVHEQARTLRIEHVVSVTGVVAPRFEGKRNPKLPTGEIEIKVTDLVILNRSETLPFEVSDEGDLAGEELRLRHRYLDLRRKKMQEVLRIRHDVCRIMREYLSNNGFLEVETPMLGRSTPEGARDYLVPSRLSPGSWYALPQSPQLYKQILMVANCDRYFQIARCFRDEDLRANRQPEFTQLDVEMSFVDADDVIGMIEGLCVEIMQKIAGKTFKPPFPRIVYEDAMRRFGCDKPDLRFAMEIVDATAIAKRSTFEVFRNASCVRGLNAKGAAEKYSRKQLDELTAFAGEFGAKGLAWMKVEADKLNSPTAKFLSPELQTELRAAMGAEVGDLLLFVASDYEATHAPLNALRNRLGKELKLYDPAEFHLSWVVEFPMFERDEETKRWVAKHHPFTTLLDKDWEKLDSNPETVCAKAYDLVLNGEEAGGGTIRIHRPELQQKIFNLLGMDDNEAKARFGFLLEALKYGAPPHGGIALGLDRWVMILAGLDNIRDCIAFPKTQKAADLMTGAPAPVEARQLKELGFK